MSTRPTSLYMDISCTGPAYDGRGAYGDSTWHTCRTRVDKSEKTWSLPNSVSKTRSLLPLKMPPTRGPGSCRTGDPLHRMPCKRGESFYMRFASIRPRLSMKNTVGSLIFKLVLLPSSLRRRQWSRELKAFDTFAFQTPSCLLIKITLAYQ